MVVVLDYDKLYFVNYNKLLTYDVDRLFDIIFYSKNKLLVDIAIEVLVRDNRLIDSKLSYHKLYKLIDLLTIDQLAYLSNFGDYYPIALLSKMKILNIIGMSFYKRDDDNVPFVLKK